MQGNMHKLARLLQAFLLLVSYRTLKFSRLKSIQNTKPYLDVGAPGTDIKELSIFPVPPQAYNHVFSSSSKNILKLTKSHFL